MSTSPSVNPKRSTSTFTAGLRETKSENFICGIVMAPALMLCAIELLAATPSVVVEVAVTLPCASDVVDLFVVAV
jgi:hypothetical protein